MTATDQAADAAPAAGAATPPQERSLWGNQDFLKFWFGETISLFGSHVTTLGLPLTAVLVFNASDEQVGLLRFLQLVPYLGLALLFGVWVDRWRRRHVLLTANLIRMLLIGLVPVLYWLDLLSMGPLLVIACGIGIVSVLFDVSFMSYVPTLVRDPKHYVEANAKLGVTSSAADVAGPGVAGALVAALTAPVALVVDAVSYLASLISLALIRVREPEPTPSTVKRRLLPELRDGLAFVFRHPILRPLALVAPFCNGSLVMVWTLFLIYAARDVRLNPAAIGFVLSAAAVGGLIGAALSRAVIRRFPFGLAYAVSMSAIFLAPALVPLASGPRVVMVSLFTASFFISYLGLGVANVVMMSLRQTSTPQSLMGRMNAAFRTMLFGGGALGGLFAGILAGAMGARGALTAAAIGSAVVVVGLVISPVSRLRELPPAPTEPDAGAQQAGPAAPQDGTPQDSAPQATATPDTAPPDEVAPGAAGSSATKPTREE